LPHGLPHEPSQQQNEGVATGGKTTGAGQLPQGLPHELSQQHVVGTTAAGTG